MTRERIIHGLYRGDSKAIKEAIKTLEQQPCEDVVSRQAVIEAFQMFREYESNRNNKEWVDRIENIVNQLPPVQPKPIECEDTISRAAAVKVASGYCHPANIAKELAKLPPVTPKTECSCDQIKWERDMAIAQLKELGYGLGEKPKVGHWIEIAQYSDGKHKIECSECKSYIVDRGHANSFNVKNKYKYCPNCGAKMVEPQERSDKE